jgi:hypothetical protein
MDDLGKKNNFKVSYLKKSDALEDSSISKANSEKALKSKSSCQKEETPKTPRKKL